MQIILGITLLLVVFYLMGNTFNKSSAPSQKTLLYIALSLAVGILLLLVVTGRLHVLAALGAGLFMILRKMPWLLRSIPIIRWFLKNQTASGQSANQESSLETSLIRMTLDHETGAMDGTIIAGTYTGQRLSTLSVGQLAGLYRSAVLQYQDSVEVLETYFERIYGIHWRAQFDVEDVQSDPRSEGTMSVADAKDILGLNGEYTEKEVTDSHRRLMQKFHPDRGGSNYLAAKINEAKQKLLAHLRNS